MSKELYYPKIESLFNRDENFKVIPGDYRLEEFSYVDKWLVTEKIDGTNLSLYFDYDSAEYRGRTESAQFNKSQVEFLDNLLDSTRDAAVGIMDDYKLGSFEVFGELFGAGIQRGGGYGPLQFRAYDMRVDERVFLGHYAVEDNADRLEINTVQYWPDMTTDEIVDSVEEGFDSWIPGANKNAEGVVAKTANPLYTQNGKRLIAKLKTKDFS